MSQLLIVTLTLLLLLLLLLHCDCVITQAAIMLPESAECPQTKSKMKIGGPIWTDPTHDEQWVLALLRRIVRNCPNIIAHLYLRHVCL
jgi:tRNA G26 N,N-dimethylase Trm1